MAINNTSNTGGQNLPFASSAQAQAGVSQNTIISPFTLKSVVGPIQDTIDAIEGINDLQAFASEVNLIESSVGLQPDGSFVAPVGTSYLGSITNIKGGLTQLDTQLATTAGNLSSEITNRIADVNAEEARALAAESALQTELNTTQTGAGLNTNGSYTAPVGSNYLGSATSLKGADVILDTQVKQVRDQVDAILLASDADKDSFAEIVALINSVDIANDQALATFVGNVNSSMGGATNGTKANYTSTNYVLANDSYNAAVNKIDTKLLDLQGQLDDVVDVNATQALQSELDATQTGAGLGANGTYTANPSTTFISTAVSLKDADNKLDTQINTVTTDLNNLDLQVDGIQTELDNTQSGAGLGANGAYTAFASSNYLTTAVSLKDADNKLDARIKINSDDIVTLDGRVDQHDSDISGIATELNNIETAVGLEANGTKTNFSSSNVITANSSFKAAIEALDTYIDGLESGNGVVALQSEVDSIETAVGLNTDGTYSAHSGTTYLDNATSVKNALTLIDTELDTIKDKSLYVNSYYVNDGVNDIQSVINSVAGGGSAYAIYVGSGSYGGATVTISDAPSGMLINGPFNPTGVHRCEWVSRGLTISGATTTRVVINNIEIEGAVTINGTLGRHLFKNVIFGSTVTINNACANFITFEDCSFAGGITITSNVTATVTFSRCAMGNQFVTSQRAGAGSPLLTILAECSGLNTSQTNLTSNVALVGRTGYNNQTVYQFQNADVYIYDLANGLSTTFSGSYTELRNKPTIPTAYTDEEARDAAGTALANGTHTGISFTNDDGNNKINAVVSLASFTTNDLTQGATNKYYTAATAKTDLIVNNTNGSETDQAPSVNAIKSYVDNKFEQAVQGLDFHAACKTASNGSNVNIASGPASISGYSFTASGERVLLKDQTDAKQNGIYDWNGLGSAMTRSGDSNDDPDGEVTGGMLTFIQEGDLAGTSWVLTAPEGSVTLGVDNLTFVQFSGGGLTYSGGNGITVSGTSISLDLNELTPKTTLDATDKFALADASASGAPKTVSLANLANKLAGSGLSASSGVLAVDASNNVTITGSQTITGDKTFSGTTTISGSIGLGSSATATTKSQGNNSTSIATTAYVDAAIDAAFTAEEAQDAVNTMLTNGTHNGISYSYNDISNALSSTVSITGSALTWPTVALNTGTTTGVVGNYYYTSTTLQGTAYTITPPSPGNNGDVLYVHNLGGNTINFGTTAYYYNGAYSGTGQTFTSTENDVFVFTRFGTGNAWFISKQTSHPRISAGTGLSLNSTTGVLTNSITQYTDEMAQDAVNTLLTNGSGSNTGISFSYNDSTPSLSATVSLNSFSINELSDVDTSTTTPTNGQILVWNNSSSKWVPGDQSGGSGVTFASGNRSISSNTNAAGTNSEEYYIATAALTLTLPVPSNSNVNNKIIVKSYTNSAVTIAANAGSNHIMYDSTSLQSSITHTANFSGFATSLICQQIGAAEWAWIVV